MKNIYKILFGIILIFNSGQINAGNIVVNSVAVNPKPAIFPPEVGLYQNVRFAAINFTSAPITGGSGTCYIEVRLSGLDFGEAFNPAIHIDQTEGQNDFTYSYNSGTKIIRFSLAPGTTWGGFETYNFTVNRLITQYNSPIQDPTIGLQAIAFGSPSENTVTTDDSGEEYTYSEPFIPTPVNLSAFSAVMKNCDAQLNWTSKSEVNFNSYIVQKSIDGKSFADVKSVKGTGKGGDYNLVDNDIQPGRNFYRLKLLDIDGSVNYSNVVYVNNQCDQNKAIKVYPNPTSDLAFIQFELPEGNYNIEIFNELGNSVKSLSHKTGGEKSILEIDRLKVLQPGVYVIKVTSDSNAESYFERLIIQ